MKKYILALGICLCASSVTVFSQEKTEAQQELDAYMSEGIVKFKSKDDKFSFRVGGRVAMDGAYYFDDYTDRGSGAKFQAARIRLFSQIGKAIDIKLDFDLISKSVIKDAYLRWHTNKNGFLKFGNYAEPFSAENIQSTMDYPFINKSATVEAFGTGRALGFSYRYYNNYFWVEGGLFSQKLATEYNQGDMGYSASARLLGRMTNDNWNFHIGGSFNYRRPDANGFTNGSDDYNRSVVFASGLESSIDGTKFLNATVNNVKGVFKYGIEGMANFRNIYVKGDFDFTKSTRIDRNNSVAFHIGFGIAYPYGNSNILPFEKRYFSGGANSVRGWSVRSLGPGSYSGGDKNINFINQSGDIKLDINLEYRAYLFWKLNGAFFIDAGNIWTIREYEDQPGGAFRFKDFYKQIALSYGIGLRLNLDFFILRLDAGMKAIDPAYKGRAHYPITNPDFSKDLSLHFAVGLPF